MEDWDDLYRETIDYFGPDPDCTEQGAGRSSTPRDRGRTYLEPGELAGLFPDFELVHSWEGLTPEHRHGDGPPERHGRAEAVFRR